MSVFITDIKSIASGLRLQALGKWLRIICSRMRDLGLFCIWMLRLAHSSVLERSITALTTVSTAGGSAIESLVPSDRSLVSSSSLWSSFSCFPNFLSILFCSIAKSSARQNSSIEKILITLLTALSENFGSDSLGLKYLIIILLAIPSLPAITWSTLPMVYSLDSLLSDFMK